MNGVIHVVNNYNRGRSEEGDVGKTVAESSEKDEVNKNIVNDRDVHTTVAKNSAVEDGENGSSGNAPLTTTDEAVTVSASKGEVQVLGEVCGLVAKEPEQFAPSGAQSLSKLFFCEPFGLMAWIGELSQHVGYRLLVMLFTSQHAIKGFVVGALGPAKQYVFASYKVEGPRMQIFGGVVALPWAMKPVFGLLSDAFPILGYNKGPYITFFAVLGALGCTIVGAVPQSYLTVEVVVACMFLIFLEISSCDLLTEAKYAEKIQACPQWGPSLVTYVWFGMNVGGLVAGMIIGPMLELWGPKTVYLMCVVPLCSILLPTWMNYLEETRLTSQEAAAMRQKLFAQKEVCFLCILMLLCTVSLSFLGIFFEDVRLSCIAAVVVAFVLLGSFSLTLMPLIAKVNVFFLLQSSFALNYGGVSFYFYTDTPEQYPDGPHFSMTFYTSVLGIVSALCSMAGIYSYQRFMQHWSYRKLLSVSNVVFAVLSISDVIFFARLNKKYGIPDHAFVLGASALEMLVQQWMWMPGIVLNAQLCPKGMESVMYALLASCYNIGSNIARNTGAYLLVTLGCTPSGAVNETAMFENLWIASFLSILLPLFTLLLIPVLIPDALQSDTLLPEGARDATTGSLWKRWTGQVDHSVCEMTEAP